jgi:hypothetical protein
VFSPFPYVFALILVVVGFSGSPTVARDLRQIQVPEVFLLAQNWKRRAVPGSFQATRGLMMQQLSGNYGARTHPHLVC